jgi:tRNA-dihydrouridine synthase A
MTDIPPPQISVAPMMGYTDRHCRAFHRALSPRATLYTPMITTGALLHGDAPAHLDFDPAERPVVLQLGGSEPDALARCAALAARWGYDAVNLNCGCPSPRVQRGRFGACLMAEPGRVAACVAAMRAAGPLPVTVKCRTGVDAADDLPFLLAFARAVADAGAAALIIHARKCWLEGLSPKDNRTRPPLDYARVHAVRRALPHVPVVINGGFASAQAVAAQAGLVDGVMIGRAALSDPWLLAELDPDGARDRAAVARTMVAYMRRPGVEARAVARHMTGLFRGRPGARAWRIALSAPDVTPDAVARALEGMG